MIGLKEAFNYALQIGIENIQLYNEGLCLYFRNKLSTINAVTVHDKGTNKSSIITFRKKDRELNIMMKQLEQNNVYFSEVIKSSALLDFEKKGIDWAIRFSPHYFNTKEDVDKACNIIESL